MPTINNNLANNLADHLANTVMGAATLTIYDGTPPADADAALSSNTALATHTIAGFVTNSSGVATADEIADDEIDASGTASFARMTAGSNVMQLSLGVSGSGADVIVSSTTFVAGNDSSITSLVITQAKS